MTHFSCPPSTREEATSNDRMEARPHVAHRRGPSFIDAPFHFTCGLITGVCFGAMVVLAVLGG